jgi:hypothetical protein
MFWYPSVFVCFIVVRCSPPKEIYERPTPFPRIAASVPLFQCADVIRELTNKQKDNIES